MDTYVAWIIANWATALVYYALAGLAITNINVLVSAVKGESPGINVTILFVFLPTIYIALLLGAIIRWVIEKIRYG